MKKILYIECKSGAAGDMLMGALYSLMDEAQKKSFLEQMNAVLPEISVHATEKNIRGVGGTHMQVMIAGREEDEHMHESGQEHEHEHMHESGQEHGHMHQHTHATEHIHGHGHTHEHRSYADILEKIQELPMSDAVKENAQAVYQILGKAESFVHRTTLEQIHFHEVGSLDALIDITGCCLALEMLAPDEILCSPVCVGNGTVRCAHGILPVPAPATAEIIKGMPVYTSDFDAELLTPTGAALLKYFAQKYTRQMNMQIENIGYGAGTRDFPQAGFVRAFFGTAMMQG